MLHFAEASPKEGDDASEIASIMTLLRKNNGDGGIDCVAKKEWCSSEAEGSAVSVDITLDGECAGNAFLLAHAFSAKVGVAAEMALLGQGTVQQDTESMISGTMESYQLGDQRGLGGTVFTVAQSGEEEAQQLARQD